MSHTIAYWRSHLFRNWRPRLLFSQVRAAAALSLFQGSSQRRSCSSWSFFTFPPGERSVAQNGVDWTLSLANPSSCACSCLFCYHFGANDLLRHSSICPNYSTLDLHQVCMTGLHAFTSGKTYRYFCDWVIPACRHERPRSQACARTGTFDLRRQMSHFAYSHPF